MNSRPVLFACLLLVCCFSPVRAGSRRPGAKAPVGPPPGGVAITHPRNDIRVHLDRETRRLDRLLKEDDSPTPGSTGSNVSNSAIGLVPGSKPAYQASKPAAPHHLIGDPPLPSSFEDLGALDHLPGTRRPGARPAAYPTTHPAPHHLIGDPPKWPDDLGTYLYSLWDPGDDRGLLPGEINIYTSPLNISGGPGNPIYSQTVFNWNPTTGMGRNISWISQEIFLALMRDPSTVYFYYYPPAPVTPPPAPTTNPTRTEQGMSVSGNLNDPHIYLGMGQANPLAGVLPSQSGEVATGSLSGQSITGAAVAESSYVTYYGGSGSPGTSGGGQHTTSVGFSPEDFTDNSDALASIPSSDVSDFIPDISPVSSQTVLAALVGPNAWSSDSSSSGGASMAGTALQGQTQTKGTSPNTVPEGASPVVEDNPNPESGGMVAAQTDNGSGTQGSGSALPLGLGLVGLLVGAGAVAGARKVMSWGQNDTDSDEVWVDPNPPSPEQQAKDLNLEVATEAYQPKIQADQQAIQQDTRMSQQEAEWSQRDNNLLSQATQQRQQNTQELQQDEQELQPLNDEINEDDEKFGEITKEFGGDEYYLQNEIANLATWVADMQEDRFGCGWVWDSQDNKNIWGYYDWNGQAEPWEEYNVIGPPAFTAEEVAEAEDELNQLEDDLSEEEQEDQSLQQDINELCSEEQPIIQDEHSVDADITYENQEISNLSDQIQYYQDDETRIADDISEKQADENTAQNQYDQAFQDYDAPDDSQGDDEPDGTDDQTPDDSTQQDNGSDQPGSDDGSQDPRLEPFVNQLMEQGYSFEEALLEWQDLINSGDPEKIAIVTAMLQQGLSLDDAKNFADLVSYQHDLSPVIAFLLGIVGTVQAALEYALARAADAVAAGEDASLWQRIANYLSGSGAAGEEAGTGASEGAGAAANELGAAREKYVADQIGGQVPESPLKINTQYGPAQIDVVGPQGQLIEVGGPGKALDPSGFGRQMQRLEAAAEATGTQAQFYYDQGTPESILEIARKWLGSANVIPFNSGQ